MSPNKIGNADVPKGNVDTPIGNAGRGILIELVVLGNLRLHYLILIYLNLLLKELSWAMKMKIHWCCLKTNCFGWLV